MSSVTALRTRFAPSPTGYLHLGHAASAWHVWAEAKRLGASVVLRIEDIDTTRCRPNYTEAIYEDLSWLGFEWPLPVRTQSEHFSDYDAVVQSLAERGLAYRCFLTRSEIAERFPNGRPISSQPLAASEEAERIERGHAFAWRLSLAQCREALGSIWGDLSFREMTRSDVVRHQAKPEIHGDIVLARKDSPSAYHVAATHDDALQGVTHVIRGRDLEDAPHVQVLLQALMGWPPVTYLHHDLILDPSGERLSKSNKSVSLRALRAEGLTPLDIWQRLRLE